MSWKDKIADPDCTLCELHDSANNVCLMGAGSKSSEIMIVGEAPGYQEDEEGEPFIGAAGQLLNKLLDEFGKIDRDECYITNVAKCRPPQNRTPTRKEIKICVEEYLIKEIDRVEPRWVLALGNAALQGVLGKSGITKHRGTRYEFPDFTVMASFHPAAVLRNPRYGTELAADLERFGKLTRGEDGTPTTKVRMIRTAAQMKWLLRKLNSVKAFAYDIETNGLQEYRSDSKIVSIAFTWNAGESVFIPIHHKQTPWKNPQQVLDALVSVMKDSPAKKIAHNGKFDARWLAQFGVEVTQTFDTMLAAHMLDENRAKGLKPLSQLFLQADAYDLGDELKDAENVSLVKLATYNAKDTDYTFRLYQTFRKELWEEKRVAKVFKHLMIPASNALVPIERRGIQVDWERWLDRNVKTSANIKRLEDHMKEQYVKKSKRGNINFNSPIQVAEWLFGDLDLEILEETKTGNPSTKESVLLQLAREHKVAAILLKYRKWKKYSTTYLGPWAKWADEDMRIHPTYKLFGTVTGRLSCTDPNLQQVPREPFIRGILGARKGYVFVEADYSQIELRIAAMLAHEKRMLRMFAQGADIHMNTAVEMTGKTPDTVEKEERKKAKAVNFGFLYSMGAEKFVTYARDNYGVDITLPEAEAFREKFFASYPALRPWHERQKRLAHRYKRVHSAIGRVRHLPDIDSRDKGVRGEAERQAINSPVQSLASDFTLLAMILLSQLGLSILGLVHDALLFEMHEDEVEKTLPIIKQTMENLPLQELFELDVTVPIEVELKVGTHWSEGEVWTP